MDINIERYQSFYDNNIDKITTAYMTVLTFPCDELLFSLSDIKKYLVDIMNLTNWEDSVKNVFVDNIMICYDELSKIEDNILDNWKMAEKIYKELPEAFENFKGWINTLRKNLNNKPVNNYDTITADGSSQSVYEEALDNWRITCKSCASSCENAMSDILVKINQLKNINEITINLSIASFANLSFGYIKKSKFAYTTDESSYKSISDYTREKRINGKLIVRYDQFNYNAPWNKNTISGISIRASGCGSISFATALTTALTYQNGSDIYVTPLDVATALDDYAKEKKHSNLRLYFSPDNGMNDYPYIASAISEIYGVTILYSEYDNREDLEILKNVTSGNSSTFIYSYSENAEYKHVASISAVDENKIITADTLLKAYNNLETEDFIGTKKYMILSSMDYTIKGNNILKEGLQQYPDIGNISYIVIDGKTYEVKKQNVEGTDLYEYLIIDYEK